MIIGSYNGPDAAGLGVIGEIDDVRIYNRAVSAFEVQQLYAYESTPPQSFLTNGLVAYYPFNGNANDAAGTNDGTLNGTDLKFSLDRFGQPQSALFLNTTSTYAWYLSGAYVAAPRAASLDFNHDFTLSAWVNISTLAEELTENLISNGRDDIGMNVRMFSRVAFTGEDFLQFIGGGNFASGLPRFRDSWWQATVVRSGSNVGVFKNSSLLTNVVMTTTVNGPSIWFGKHMDIGGNGSWYPLAGGIDDVRMYNRALSTNEVAQLYAYESTPPQSFLTNGLVAYYQFNGNANDASGNGHNGIVENAIPAVDRFGNRNACYQFASSWIFVPYNASLYPSNQTISAWFKNTGVYHDTAIVRAGNVYDDFWRGYTIGTRDFNSNFGFTDYSGSGYAAGAAAPVGQWPLNTWAQLIVTRGSNSAALYINAQLISSNTNLPRYVPVEFSPLYIGSGEAPGKNGADTLPTDVPGSFWQGSIDDVRIYNRALSTYEVQQLYAFESASPAPNINSQPVSQSVNQGSPVSFSVTATGTGLNFQWRLNSVNISGATNDSYILASATTNDAGIYNVIVSNAGGSVTSSNAVLMVIVSPRTATGTATLFDLFVVGVNITDGGSGYTNTPVVQLIGGGGSGAQAFATVSNGVVTSITVTNAGYGYTNAPLVIIDPPFIPNPVLGIAPMSFLTFSNLTVSGVYQLQQSVGWYWSNQPVSFTATNDLYAEMVAGVAGIEDYRLALNPVPAQAFATAVVDYGFVVHATVISGGSGYVTSPAVTIVGGGGTNAEAVSQISGGVVTSITVTDAGFGYTNAPTVRIAQPPAAAVFPTVFPIMRVDSTNLAPYHDYQIQFIPAIGATWGNWDGGLFRPTDATSSQYLFITNDVGFFRMQYAP